MIPDDLVSIFHKQSCNFGFVTHLFGTEIKALYSEETVGLFFFLVIVNFGPFVCLSFHLCFHTNKKIETEIQRDILQVPRGVSFRITPTSHSELLNGDEPVSTLTQVIKQKQTNARKTNRQTNNYRVEKQTKIKQAAQQGPTLLGIDCFRKYPRQFFFDQTNILGFPLPAGQPTANAGARKATFHPVHSAK